MTVSVNQTNEFPLSVDQVSECLFSWNAMHYYWQSTRQNGMVLQDGELSLAHNIYSWRYCFNVSICFYNINSTLFNQQIVNLNIWLTDLTREFEDAFQFCVGICTFISCGMYSLGIIFWNFDQSLQGKALSIYNMFLDFCLRWYIKHGIVPVLQSFLAFAAFLIWYILCIYMYIKHCTVPYFSRM